MPVTRDDVLKAALELSDADRLLLASELLETLPEDLPGWSLDDPGFLNELDRRAQDGTASIPWPEVRARLVAE